MLNSFYELLDEELDSVSLFFKKLNREIIPSTAISLSNRPRYDLLEHMYSYIILMELPGVEKENINITLNKKENQIIIIFSKKNPNKIENFINEKRMDTNINLKKHNLINQKFDIIRKERKYGTFKRVINLFENCDTDCMKASLKNGILEIEIPKNNNEHNENVKKIKINE